MSEHTIARYAGSTIIVIYMDRRGGISERRVRVDRVSEGKLRGYCWLRKGPRLFDLDRILAFCPDIARRRYSV